GELVRRMDRHGGHRPVRSARRRGAVVECCAGGRCGAGDTAGAALPRSACGGEAVSRGSYGNVGTPWQAIGVPATRRRSTGPTWRDVPLAPVTLVRGAEPLLADRTLQRIADLAREHAGGSEAIEQTVLEAATYEKGTLEVLASPSLFGEHRHVVVQGAEAASDALI